MKTYHVEQGTEEWRLIRAGVPSASNFAKVVTSKGEPSKQAKKYLYRLAGELSSGFPEDTYKSEAMQKGVERETEARKFYEETREVEVKQVGFCLADEGYGYSPDGLVGNDGLIEIKCPLASTHVEYLMDKKFPTAYVAQVQGGLLVTGRAWCDFVSYHPGTKLFVVRVQRDEEFIKLLHKELVGFCGELSKVVREVEYQRVDKPVVNKEVF